ncbi:MAG: hypothetical protein RSF84_08015 [Ruthenibacterium sp.]
MQYEKKCNPDIVPPFSGLVHVGIVQDDFINGGAPVPVFESKARTDGKPSINTLEGWNAFRYQSAQRTLLCKQGRMPTEAEIQHEMLVNAALAAQIVEGITT